MLSKNGQSPETPYDAFEHLWRGINLEGDRQRLMVMLTAYLDESFGTANAYSVGGYIATVEQWVRFVQQWTKFLGEEQIPGLHKSDMENCRGDYARWRTWKKKEQDRKKMRINGRACDIILGNLGAGFAVSVIKSDWEGIEKGFSTPALGESFYAAAAFSCIRQIARWADGQNYHGPIDYVFERGGDGYGEVDQMMRFFDSMPRVKALFRLNTWSSASKKNFVFERKNQTVCFPAVIPLQAADYIAYETYRQMGNRVVSGIKTRKDGTEIGMRACFTRLLQLDRTQYQHLEDEDVPVPHYIRYWDREALVNTLEVLRESAKPAGFDPEQWWKGQKAKGKAASGRDRGRRS